MKITLRLLLEQQVIDENQKVMIYRLKRDNGIEWVNQYKGYIRDLKDNSMLDDKSISISEIQKEDRLYLRRNDFVNNYIGIYLEEI